MIALFSLIGVFGACKYVEKILKNRNKLRTVCFVLLPRLVVCEDFYRYYVFQGASKEEGRNKVYEESEDLFMFFVWFIQKSFIIMKV